MGRLDSPSVRKPDQHSYHNRKRKSTFPNIIIIKDHCSLTTLKITSVPSLCTHGHFALKCAPGAHKCFNGDIFQPTCWGVSLPDSLALSGLLSASCWCWRPSTPWSRWCSTPEQFGLPCSSEWRQLHETETTWRGKRNISEIWETNNYSSLKTWQTSLC